MPDQNFPTDNGAEDNAADGARSPNSGSARGANGWTHITGPFGLTFVSNVLLWLALPPVGVGWLAWVAPVPMLLLVINPSWQYRRPLLKAWLASLIFWLATLYFIPFPHPILIIGWCALSAYLAVYTPLMLWVARTMIWRWNVPTLLAVPVAWTGLEWIRMNFLTGFAMAGLSYTQYANPIVIQIADLSGAYTVTFAIAAFATSLAAVCFSDRRLQGCVGCVLVMVSVFGYGKARLSQEQNANQRGNVTVALIQTSIDTILAPKTDAQVVDELSQLREVSLAARQSNDSIALMVWPESSYPYGNYVSEDAEDKDVLISRSNLKEIWAEITHGRGQFPAIPGIIGTSTIDREKKQVFNSAVLLDDQGRPSERYDKNHRVMFGEYVPLLEYFPTLMQYVPLGRNNLTPGDSAQLLETGELKIAPNVCFESTVAHLIRRQLNAIASEQSEPDVLLNITNDGWFFGTSCLDLHYACNVFRAVEMRKPMLVCANTGLSAHIDPWGKALKKGQRRKAEFLICEVSTDAVYPTSLYRKIGDVIPMLMGWGCVAVMIAGGRVRSEIG